MGIAGGLLGFFATYKYQALILLLTVEEAGVPLPLPGDMLVMYAGALFARGAANAVVSILAAFAGVTMGSSLLYFLMLKKGRPFVHKYGPYLHLKPDRVQRVEGWYRRHGAWMIPLGRLIPGLRIPTTIVSGLSGVPYRVFGPLNAVSALIWSGFYFVLGVILGEEWWRLEGMLKVPYWTPIILVALAVLLLVAIGSATLWQRRRSRNATLVEPAVVVLEPSPMLKGEAALKMEPGSIVGENDAKASEPPRREDAGR